MKKNIYVLLTVVIVSLLVTTSVFAQDAELTLRLSRDFGYSSGAGDIQGLFSMKVTGPENLVRVVFYVDQTVIGEDTETPFKAQFDTDNFEPGFHEMYAVGFLSDGAELKTRVVTSNFVSAEESQKLVAEILVPVGILVLVALLASAIVPMITGRKTRALPLGTERQYGVYGGTICPKCERPYAMSMFGLNLLMYRFHRCPFCGKWSLVRRQSIEALRAAEKAELAAAAGEPVEMISEQEKLKRELDSSRFEDV